MTEQNPQYDASRVMFNGAAIALVTNLINGVKEDMQRDVAAFEDRQSRRLEAAVEALSGDVDALEEWRSAQEDARLIRQGQLSIFKAFGAFVLRYDRAILGFSFTLLAVVLASLFGVHIGIGEP